MKKNWIRNFLLCVSLATIMGCGNSTEENNVENTTESSTENSTEAEETGTIYLKDINVDEYVTLGEYKGLEVTATLAEITDEEVENYITYINSSNVKTEEITDRDVVENGDIANIDYEGKKDGVAFDGGTDTGYDLTIGSGSFISGFEEGLVGVKVGETVDLNLTFPENYPAADLAGEEVVFTVTVNSISREVPVELNDEVVQEMGIENVNTMEEYRQYVKEYLEEQAMAEYTQNVQMELISMVLSNSEVKDAPQKLQQKYIDVTNEQMEYQAAYYGVDLETMLATFYGVDLEGYNAETAAGAAETAKYAMICKKIAQLENLEVTEEELDKTVEANYEAWGYSTAEEFKTANDMDEYSDSLLIDKVLDFLMENATITEETAEAEE